MNVQTKFSAGDKVWFLRSDTIVSKNIYKTVVTQYTYDPANIKVHHVMGSEDFAYKLTEDNMYRTKKEAGEAFLKANGLDCGVGQ